MFPIMRFIIHFTLGLSWLTKAASIPCQDDNVTSIEARSGGANFRSVAYFTNWVRFLLQLLDEN